MADDRSQPHYVSNDSSQGGDSYYDAMEDLEKQRLSSVGGASSVSYGSTSRARSSSATLIPTAAAAELMAALVSSESNKNLDLSDFATAGEFGSSGSFAVDEGGPGGTLGLDTCYEHGSKNPFANAGKSTEGEGGTVPGGWSGRFARQQWPIREDDEAAKMVVTDISSTEATPVHTPVRGNSVNGEGGGPSDYIAGDRAPSTLPWAAQSPSPSPPLASRCPPLRREEESSRACATNPFASGHASGRVTIPSNPFAPAKAHHPFNPFDESPLKGAEEVHVADPKGEGPTRAPDASCERGGPSGRLNTDDAGPGVDTKVGASRQRPPPLPPRKAPNATSTETGQARLGGRQSKRASPRSTTSSATNGSSGVLRAGHGDTLEVGSVGLSAASGSSNGNLGKKFMVVNKDTGQKFDVRDMEQHLPATEYSLLPTRGEVEQRQVAEPSTEADGPFKPKSVSPRSSLSSTVAASMAAAVGTTTSRREKAKHLRTIMRKRLGQVASAAGAAAAAASAGGNGGSEPAAADASSGDHATRPTPSGGSGDRGSGSMGAAARVVSGALAGIRVSLKGKESSETLEGLMLFQELRCHEGPIWAAEFNHSGRFLATAGQDKRILLHRVGDLREELNADHSEGGGASAGEDGADTCDGVSEAPTGRNEANREADADAGDAPEFDDVDATGEGCEGSDTIRQPADGGAADDKTTGVGGPGDAGTETKRRREKGVAPTILIDTTPWQILEAHRGDVVALAWSRNDFLLSASLDKTVRLWHTTQGRCLHFFKHADIVTSVDFHPSFEHFFLSGCFDKKIRVWNIRDGRVQEWQQAPDLVTAAKFSLDGQMIVAGLMMGQVLFYQTEGMRYFTQIECRNRRGIKKRGRKVSGFAFKRTLQDNENVSTVNATGGETAKPGEHGKNNGSPSLAASSQSPATDLTGTSAQARGGGAVSAASAGAAGRGPGSHIPEQLLVSTNDSRLRLYNTDDFGMNAKYKGFVNDTLQLAASFSEDGKKIICGSENGKVFVWNTGVFTPPLLSPLPGATAIPSSTLSQPVPPPAVATTHKDTNRSYESFQAAVEPPRIITTACFVPEATARACVTAVRGRLSKKMEEAGGYCGCMILAVDFNGLLKVYCRSAVFLS